MGRPRKTAHEKLVTISATVAPSLEESIKKLAKQNHWSPSRTAGILLEKALECGGPELLQVVPNSNLLLPLRADDEVVGVSGREQLVAI